MRTILTLSALALFALLIFRISEPTSRIRATTPVPAPDGAQTAAPVDRRSETTENGVLTVRVEAEGVDGSVRIAIMDQTSVRRRMIVPLNADAVLGVEIMAGSYVVAVEDDMSGNPLLDQLRSEHVWPRPVSVRVGRTGREKRVILKFKSRSPTDGGLDIVAKVSGGGLPGARFAVSCRSDSTSINSLMAVASAGADGRLRLSGIAPGDYSAKVLSLPGMYRVRGLGQVDVSVVSGATAQISFDVAGPGTLSGTVAGAVEESRRYPFSIYREVASDRTPIRSVLSQPGGIFGPVRLPAGRYVAVFFPAGFRATRTSFDIAEDRATTITLELARGGATLSGLIESAGGTPVIETQLNVNRLLRAGELPEGQTTATDSAGKFVMYGLRPGEHRMILWQESVLKPLRIPEGRTRISFVARLPAFEGGLAVSGRLVDAHDRGIGGALVCFRRREDSSDGWAVFTESLPGGRFRLRLDTGTYWMWTLHFSRASRFVPMRAELVTIGKNAPPLVRVLGTR